MIKRVTIMMDDVLVKKIYGIQSKRIKETQKHVSFNDVLVEYLLRAIKK